MGVTGEAGNLSGWQPNRYPPVTSGFPAQRTNNAKIASISWIDENDRSLLWGNMEYIFSFSIIPRGIQDYFYPIQLVPWVLITWRSNGQGHPQTRHWSFSIGIFWCQYRRVKSWWRNQMENVSALLALCAGNWPVPGEFPAQRPVTRSFDVLFYLRLNKRLSKQSWGWCFESSSRSLWRHCNVI